jgi:hypothetical protein
VLVSYYRTVSPDLLIFNGRPIKFPLALCMNNFFKPQLVSKSFEFHISLVAINRVNHKSRAPIVSYRFDNIKALQVFNFLAHIAEITLKKPGNAFIVMRGKTPFIA